MTVIVGLLIGNETWQLQERSLRSIRKFHPSLDIIVYYSLNSDKTEILDTLQSLSVEAFDIGRPGLLNLLHPAQYSDYNTLEFNIKTSFKWLALLGAMTTRLDNVIFIDSDIMILSPLPFELFTELWSYYDIFIQDEGNSTFPKHPCTGFVGFKFCENNISLLDSVHKMQTASIVSSDSQHDQSIFFAFISHDMEVYRRIYFLPQRLFPVGYMAPIYRNFTSKKVSFRGQDDPIIYHANWAVGVPNKAALMDSLIGDSPSAGNNSDKDDIVYSIGELKVILPFDHLLPRYQKSHPEYDKFLPHLAKYLSDGETVIDVGANCGDTLAGMVSSNSRLSYVCIEPDILFHSYLEKNVRLITNVYPDCQIAIICELVGLEIKSASLTGSGGTKTASISYDGSEVINSKTLDSIYLNSMSGTKTISLLKVDTDGYDYDVLMSAQKIIQKQSPLLFFECQYANFTQLQGFTKTVEWLSESGYKQWHLFDNFGSLLLSSYSTKTVMEVIEYIWRQNQQKATRTIYYIDILAASTNNLELAQVAIQDYSLLTL